MKTVQEVISLSTDYLKQRGVWHPRRRIEELLAHVLELERLDLYMQFDRPLAETELTKCRKGVARLANKEPVQYVLGEVDFFDCVFTVTPDVLIPRQETEILVDKIAKVLEKEDLQGKELWDICCGSGCIGISLKKRFPELKVILSDLSPQALAVARQNASRNQVDIELLEGDLLVPFDGKRGDFVVCNPPYVSQGEYEGLETEVRSFEPRQALVGGVTGLEYYERLAAGLESYLNPGARVWLEIGHAQGEGVNKIFSSACWKKSLLEQDWAGKDRFFFLEIG